MAIIIRHFANKLVDINTRPYVKIIFVEGRKIECASPLGVNSAATRKWDYFDDEEELD